MAALAGAATAQELGFALKIYTSNSGYLRACKEGTPRIGLDGEAAGQVTADEAANAKQRLAQQRQHNSSGKSGIGRAVSIDTTHVDTKPKRLGLSDLRTAAQARRAMEAAE